MNDSHSHRPIRRRRSWQALWFGLLGGVLVGGLFSVPWENRVPAYPLPEVEQTTWIAPVLDSQTIAALHSPAPTPRFQPNTERPTGYFRLPLSLPSRPVKCWFEWQTQGTAFLYWNGRRLVSETDSTSRYQTSCTDLTRVARAGSNVLAVAVSDRRVPGLASLRGVLHLQFANGEIRKIGTDDPAWEASTLALRDPASGDEWHRPSVAHSTLLQRPEQVPSPASAPHPRATLSPDLLQSPPGGRKWSWIGSQSERVTLDSRLPGGSTAYLMLRSTARHFVFTGGADGIEVVPADSWLVLPLKPSRHGSLRCTMILPPSDSDQYLELSLWHRDAGGRCHPLPLSSQDITTSSSVVPCPVAQDEPQSLRMAPEVYPVANFHRSRFLFLSLLGAGLGLLLCGWRWSRPQLQLRVVQAMVASLGWLALMGLVQVATFAENAASGVLLTSLPGVLTALGLGLSSTLLLVWLRRTPREFSTLASSPQLVRWAAAVIVLIVGVGIYLRSVQVHTVSLDQDEMTMLVTTAAIPKYGYPGAMLPHRFKPLATYELLTYSLAGGVLAHGWTEFGARFHSLVYGSLSILLMGLLGWRMFGRTAGLLALAVAAVIPWSVSMSAFAFYPAQMQFFLLLTLVTFYEACRPSRVNLSWLAAATACFILTYLSWEGSGFLLLALGLGLVLFRTGQWRQALRPGFLAALAVIFSAVLLQRGYRILTNEAFYGIGPGLSAISPLDFLRPNGNLDVTFYLRKTLFLEHHWPFTLLLLASLPLALRRREFRFLFGVLAVLLTCYSLFLSNTALRYGYIMQAPLILLGIGGAVLLWQEGQRLLPERGEASSRPRETALSSAPLWFPWVVTLLLACQAWIIPSDAIRPFGGRPESRALTGRQHTDFRRACHVAGALKAEQDLVIATFPHSYRFYTGDTPDFALQTTWKGKLILVPDEDQPQIVERFGGIRTITNRHELMQTLSQTDRPVWFVLTPAPLAKAAMQPEVWNLLEQGSEVVFESSDAMVLRFQPEKVPVATWALFQSQTLPLNP